jgi:hypothetical protein
MQRFRLVLDIVGRVLWAGVAVVGVMCVWSYASTTSTVVGLSAPQQAGLAADNLLYVIGAYIVARAWSQVTRWGRA